MADMREKLKDIILEADMSLFGTDKSFAEVYADYLIENGVILLPCKVGDTVYYYNGDFEVILPYFVENLNIAYYNEKENYYTYEANCADDYENELLDSIDFDLDDIGQTVFLTREEAEKALAERN